jgi:hypothetical protein
MPQQQAGETAAVAEVLRGLPEGEPMALGELLGRFGSRAHGVALFLLALPDAVPLPIPSVSAILGIPLALISGHLVLFGEKATLPRRIRSWTVPAAVTGALRRYMPPVFDRIGHLSYPRLRPVARRERAIGAVCLMLALLLLLPIPFFNTPPAICLALLAWGMVQRDGLVVLAGLAGTAAIGGVFAVLADWAGTVIG